MAHNSNLEKIEQQALDAWFDTAQFITSDELQWTRATIGEAICYVSSTEPSILVNRVLNLGDTRPPTHEELIDIRSLYREAGVTRFFLHVFPASLRSDYEELLADAGFKRYRGWMKFCRGDGVVNPITSELDVRRIGPEDAAAFASIVGDAFDFGKDFQPAIAALLSDQNWHVYMSFDGDTPAGTGAMYCSDATAYLDFGATQPDHRRRGSQSAILSTRIRAALDAGCTSIVTMTGEAVPGDEQHSYRNIQRAGFVEEYLRENWIPQDG